VGGAHPLLKGTSHQNVLQDFVPDPGTIRPYVRDAVRASGKPSDTVKGRCIRSRANLSKVSRHPGRIQFQHRLDRRLLIGSFSVVARADRIADVVAEIARPEGFSVELYSQSL